MVIQLFHWTYFKAAVQIVFFAVVDPKVSNVQSLYERFEFSKR